MNGIPASIVIRHLMAGPAPTKPSHHVARTARPVSAHDEVPPSARTLLTRWVAVFGALVIGVTVASALLAVDPSTFAPRPPLS